MESMEEYKKRMDKSIENLDVNEFKRSLFLDKDTAKKEPVKPQNETREESYTPKQSNQMIFLAIVLSSAAFFTSLIALAFHYDKFVSLYTWFVNLITQNPVQ